MEHLTVGTPDCSAVGARCRFPAADHLHCTSPGAAAVGARGWSCFCTLVAYVQTPHSGNTKRDLYYVALVAADNPGDLQFPLPSSEQAVAGEVVG